jgi:predicted RND superfamily exporter protein
VVLVFLATAEAGAAELAPVVARVRAEVAALAPAAQGLEVGYAGDAAIAVEELSALESDVLVSALLVLVGVVLAILLYFRWWRALPVLALPLAVGTLWGFGLASSIVSSLGSSTAFLARSSSATASTPASCCSRGTWRSGGAACPQRRR